MKKIKVLQFEAKQTTMNIRNKNTTEERKSGV